MNTKSEDVDSVQVLFLSVILDKSYKLFEPAISSASHPGLKRSDETM